MKALVTGAGGTLGPVLVEVLRTVGWDVVPWRRTVVSPEDPAACQSFLDRCLPDVCFHLAVGPVDWTGFLAAYAARRGIPFVHTSSVSVYGGHQRGPFSIRDEPEPQDDYGRYKKAGEERIAEVYPGAVIARIGWQIGLAPGANHMVDHLTRTQAEHGRIEASRNWFQACSFLDDTARTLMALAESDLAGLVHLDANPGISFFELVTGLNGYLNAGWTIQSCEEPVLDNRLLEDRVHVKSILRWSLPRVL